MDNVYVHQGTKLLMVSVQIAQDTHNIYTEYVFVTMVTLPLMAHAKSSPALIPTKSTTQSQNHANAKVH